jgi:hypothetical protein
MDADVAALAGPRGRHNPERAAVRHGSEAGSVTLGGAPGQPRAAAVRVVDGSGELTVPAYELFCSTEILGAAALADFTVRVANNPELLSHQASSRPDPRRAMRLAAEATFARAQV